MRGTEWTLPVDRGFTGQVIEPGLGLHDYGARHLAQPLGRWIAPDTIVPDPADPQSLNRYGYVLNNPLRYSDPSGHAQVCGGSCPHDWEELASQWYTIEDQGLMDATILAWIQEHQNLTAIQGMMGFLETRYGKSGAILPASFNTMYAHGYAAGEFKHLTGNSRAQLIAGAIFAGVGIAGSQLGGLKREMAGRPTGYGGNTVVPNDRFSRINAKDLPTGEYEAVMRTIDQIEGRLPSPSGTARINWGVVHSNKEGNLPLQVDQNYYREYRVVPAGQNNAGPLRIVTGNSGEIYYTWTHYGSTDTPAFVQLR